MPLLYVRSQTIDLKSCQIPEGKAIKQYQKHSLLTSLCTLQQALPTRYWQYCLHCHFADVPGLDFPG